MKSWRSPNPHKPLFGQENPPFPATRFFDQLSYIGNPNVGCFVLETSEGLILLDCMEPLDEHHELILKGLADLGLDPKDLKAILVTHGHGDHYGSADRFREKYGCRIYMSRTDYAFARQDTKGPMGAMQFEIYDFLEDGEVFTLGDTKVHAFATPGHTPGCLSFIFKVTDEGREHWVAMWGGTGIPRDPAARQQYLASCQSFAAHTEAFGCDAEIATHPFVDSSILKLQIIRSIPDGVPNPFVLGRENYKYYEKMFENMCRAAIARDSR